MSRFSNAQLTVRKNNKTEPTISYMKYGDDSIMLLVHISPDGNRVFLCVPVDEIMISMNNLLALDHQTFSS